MSNEDLQIRLDRLSKMAKRLRELQVEAERELESISAASDPRLEAGYSMLNREVGEAARVAEALTHSPGLLVRS